MENAQLLLVVSNTAKPTVAVYMYNVFSIKMNESHLQQRMDIMT